MACMHRDRVKKQTISVPKCQPDVQAAFDAMPAAQRRTLLSVRRLIVETHQQTPQAGELIEALRWGQPSYLTEKPQTGSTIRLGLTADNRPALFCHCGTTLIGDFRRLHDGLFDFEGNRAMVIDGPVTRVKPALRDCIARALTYNLAKK